MSQADVATLVGTVLGTVLGLGLIACLVAAVFFWPIMAWLAVRNLKLIRLQLERLNATLDRQPATPAAVRPLPISAREPEIGPWQQNKPASPRI